MTVFFEQNIKVRLTKVERERLERVVRYVMNCDSPKYESVSHFVRCAINKLTRQEEES